MEILVLVLTVTLATTTMRPSPPFSLLNVLLVLVDRTALRVRQRVLIVSQAFSSQRWANPSAMHVKKDIIVPLVAQFRRSVRLDFSVPLWPSHAQAVKLAVMQTIRVCLHACHVLPGLIKMKQQEHFVRIVQQVCSAYHDVHTSNATFHLLKYQSDSCHSFFFGFLLCVSQGAISQIKVRHLVYHVNKVANVQQAR